MSESAHALLDEIEGDAPAKPAGSAHDLLDEIEAAPAPKFKLRPEQQSILGKEYVGEDVDTDSRGQGPGIGRTLRDEDLLPHVSEPIGETLEAVNEGLSRKDRGGGFESRMAGGVKAGSAVAALPFSLAARSLGLDKTIEPAMEKLERAGRGVEEFTGSETLGEVTKLAIPLAAGGLVHAGAARAIPRVRGLGRAAFETAAEARVARALSREVPEVLRAPEPVRGPAEPGGAPLETQAPLSGRVPLEMAQKPKAPSVWRELSAAEAGELVNSQDISGRGLGGIPERYVATSRDLALGQGRNKTGVFVEIDPQGLDVRVPRQTKPGAGFVEQQGGGAERVLVGDAHTIRPNVRSVRLAQGVKRDAYVQRLEGVFRREGWTKTVEGGETVYTRPEVVPAAEMPRLSPDVVGAKELPTAGVEGSIGETFRRTTADPRRLTDPAVMRGRASQPYNPNQPKGRVELEARADMMPPKRASLSEVGDPGAQMPSSTGRGVTPPPRVPSGPAQRPVAASTPPEGPTAPPGAENAPTAPTGPVGRFVEGLRGLLDPREKIATLKDYGDRLEPAVRSVRERTERFVAQSTRDWDTEFGKLSSEEQATLTPAIIEGRVKGTPAQEAFRDWSNGVSEARRQQYTEMGVRVSDKNAPGGQRPIGEIENFHPMRWSEEAKGKLTDPAFREEVFGEAAKQGIPREVMQEQLDSYKEPGLKSYYAGIERKRTFQIPDKWREQDVRKTMHEYFRRAWSDAVEHDVFNYRDKTTGAARNWADKEFQGDLGDMIGELPVEKQAAAKRLVLDLLERNPENRAPGHKAGMNAANVIGAANALRLYGLRLSTTLIQTTTNAMTNAVVGERVFADAVSRVLRDPKGALDRLSRSGSRRPYVEMEGVVEGGAGKIAQATRGAASVATAPVSVLDGLGRIVASEAAEPFAAKLQKQLNGNSWQQGVARVQLEAFDYTPAEIEAFKSGMLTAEQVDIFRQRLVHRTQGTVTNATRIPLATSPLGRVVMQGKNFAVTQARNAWRNAGRQLIEAKNPLPAARLVLGTWLISKGVNAVRNAVEGESPNRPDDFWSILKRGSPAGITSDALYEAFASKGDVDRLVDNMSESQFKDLIVDLGKMGKNVVNPPDKRIPLHELNVTLVTDRPRGEVFLEALRRVAPSYKEWERIVDHNFGDDEIGSKERGKKALSDYRKSQRVELEVR